MVGEERGGGGILVFKSFGLEVGYVIFFYSFSVKWIM